MNETESTQMSGSLTRTRDVSGWLGVVLVIAAVTAALMTLDQQRLFGQPLMAGLIRLETHFYYALMGILAPCSFLLFRSNIRRDLLYLDIVLAVASLAACSWLFYHAELILDEGWEFLAPNHAIVASVVPPALRTASSIAPHSTTLATIA